MLKFKIKEVYLRLYNQLRFQSKQERSVAEFIWILAQKATKGMMTTTVAIYDEYQLQSQSDSDSDDFLKTKKSKTKKSKPKRDPRTITLQSPTIARILVEVSAINFHSLRQYSTSQLMNLPYQVLFLFPVVSISNSLKF